MLLLRYKAKSFRLPSAAESLSLCVANGGVGRALPAGFPRIQNQERSIAFGDRVAIQPARSLSLLTSHHSLAIYE